jgi:hypothetical protein
MPSLNFVNLRPQLGSVVYFHGLFLLLLMAVPYEIEHLFSSESYNGIFYFFTTAPNLFRKTSATAADT